MAVPILLITIIMLASVLFNRISAKFGIPALLTFLLLGMAFGTEGIAKIDFENYSLARDICSFALIFIMFYGGFGTKWSEAKPVATISLLLSTAGVVFTAGFVGLFTHFVLGRDVMESFLLGAIVSSTDAASVFSILRSKKLGLKYNTASLLEVESGSNDPFAYMLTVLMLSVMSGMEGGLGSTAYMIFAQVAYGVAAGVIISHLALWVFRHFKFITEGFDAIFMVAVVLLSYSLPTLIGGNGYLAAYLVGVILGNKNIKNKKSLVNFFDGVTGLMQVLIFFLLGLLANPSQIPKVAGNATVIMVFLTFVARPLAVFMIMLPFKRSLGQILLVSWSGLRGAASIVFAILAVVSPAYVGNDIYHFVFCIVLISILVQGSLIPWVAEKLDMIDRDNNVLKTFNDYEEELPVQFISLLLSDKHPWIKKRIDNILFPPETILVLVIRNKQYMIPKGDTLLQDNDVLVLTAQSVDNSYHINIREELVESGHEWENQPIAELSISPEELIVMIIRKGQPVIPKGKTILQKNDVVVIHSGN